MKMNGKVALVTGAEQGIGRAIARGSRAEPADRHRNDRRTRQIIRVNVLFGTSAFGGNMKCEFDPIV